MEGLTEGDICWTDLDSPVGSQPGYRRPVVVVQADWVTRSGIGTVLCVPLTTNLRLAEAPGNVLFKAGHTGLPKDSVVVVTVVLPIDRSLLEERVGRLTRAELRRVIAGIDLVLAE